MKTISMDYKEYKEDLSEKYHKGYKSGSAEMLKFISMLISKDYDRAASYFFDNIYDDHKEFEKAIDIMGIEIKNFKSIED